MAHHRSSVAYGPGDTAVVDPRSSRQVVEKTTGRALASWQRIAGVGVYR